MIHSSYFEPRIFPINGDTQPSEIDRLQEFSGSVTLNRTKINEIGRDGTVGFKSGIPEISLTLRQLEYGKMEFWNQITNSAAANTSVSLSDFDTATFDIAGFKTDDDGTFLGTVVYPGLRTSGFSFSIGDPDASTERSFSMVGEDEFAYQGSNKYYIFLYDDNATGSGHTIVIGTGDHANHPAPVDDPDASGTYFVRGVRVRSGVTTELTEGTDFTYNSGTTTITCVGSVSANGDIFKFWYTAASYISGADPFTENDSDAAELSADKALIFLQTSTQVYRLQSVSVDVTFDRQDLKEIGNSEVVQRGVRESTVRITLGRKLEDWTIEEALRGVASDYGKIDVRQFTDSTNLIIKLYSSATTKTTSTFLLGYRFNNLSPISTEAGVPTKDYIDRGTVLEGEAALITSSHATLVA